jgi:hypothetical protein
MSSLSPPLPALVPVKPRRQQRSAGHEVGQFFHRRNVGVEGDEAGLFRPPGGGRRLPPLPLDGVELCGQLGNAAGA